MTPPTDLHQRALEYCKRKDIPTQTLEVLGWGQDGWVWKTSRPTAIKVLRRKSNYHTELRCYQRFLERRIREIEGLKIPLLLGFDDDLQVIEMEVVDPPHLLDFGKAYIDQKPPEFSAETMRETEEIQRDRWGKHYRRVQRVLHKLSCLGIEYADPNPDNILFPDWDTNTL